MRRNIKLVISYDGTEFAGWQIQSSDRSVQGVLTEALSDLHQESVSIPAPVEQTPESTPSDRSVISTRRKIPFPIGNSGMP